MTKLQMSPGGETAPTVRVSVGAQAISILKIPGETPPTLGIQGETAPL